MLQLKSACATWFWLACFWFATMVFTSTYLPAQGLSGTSFQYWQQGSGPFSFTDHYISNTTGIILSLYASPESLKNFAPNFRGIPPSHLPFDPKSFGQWEIEYFCQPDFVLGVYGEKNQNLIYLNRLRWRRSLLFDQVKNRIVLSFHHRPEDGLIAENLTQVMRDEIGQLQTELRMEFFWNEQANHVTVTFALTNRSATTKDYHFAAQDAAYLWFPNQKQIGLSPFLFHNGLASKRRYIVADGLPIYFAGIYSKEQGVFSGFRSIAAIKPDNISIQTSVGTSFYYLLAPPSVPIGHHAVPQDKGRDFANLIRQVQRPDSDLLNRYAAFSLSDVRPDQSFTIIFQLVMGLVSPNQDLNSRVAQVLKGI